MSIGNRRSKLSLIADKMLLNTENPKESTKQCHRTNKRVQ